MYIPQMLAHMVGLTDNESVHNALQTGTFELSDLWDGKVYRFVPLPELPKPSYANGVVTLHLSDPFFHSPITHLLLPVQRVTDSLVSFNMVDYLVLFHLVYKMNLLPPLHLHAPEAPLPPHGGPSRGTIQTMTRYNVPRPHSIRPPAPTQTRAFANTSRMVPILSSKPTRMGVRIGGKDRE